MALKDLDLKMYFDDASEYGEINVLTKEELDDIYRQISECVGEIGETVDPFMTRFINLAYGVTEKTSLTFLLSEYEKPILKEHDLIDFFGLVTTEDELHGFYDDLTEPDENNALDIFANFALLTEETTKEEIVEEYMDMVRQKEEEAFKTLLPEDPQLTKQD